MSMWPTFAATLLFALAYYWTSKGRIVSAIIYALIAIVTAANLSQLFGVDLSLPLPPQVADAFNLVMAIAGGIVGIVLLISLTRQYGSRTDDSHVAAWRLRPPGA